MILQYYNEDEYSSTGEQSLDKGPKQSYFASIVNQQITAPVNLFQSTEYTHADISFFIYTQNLKTLDQCGRLDLVSSCDLEQGCIMKVNITQIEINNDHTLSFASGFCRDDQQVCNQ